MKISGVTATIVRIARSRALKTTYGVSPSTNTVVVKVDTDAGVSGWGQTVAPAPWGGDSAEVIKLQIDRYLAPALLGEHPFYIERLHQRMAEALRGASNAATALDFALWDIKGLALDVPAHQLLGGACQAGALLHGFVERDEPDKMAARIDELAADGWRYFKTKIGFGVDEDLRWYNRLRERVADDIQFQLDGNTGYTLGAALQSLTELERMGGVALFEQPVRHLDEMAVLATRLKTPCRRMNRPATRAAFTRLRGSGRRMSCILRFIAMAACCRRCAWRMWPRRLDWKSRLRLILTSTPRLPRISQRRRQLPGGPPASPTCVTASWRSPISRRGKFSSRQAGRAWA